MIHFPKSDSPHPGNCACVECQGWPRQPNVAQPQKGKREYRDDDGWTVTVEGPVSLAEEDPRITAICPCGYLKHVNDCRWPDCTPLETTLMDVRK